MPGLIHRRADFPSCTVGVSDPALQEAYLSVQKFPAGDKVPEGQTVDVQKSGNDCLGDLLLEVLPDEILFSGEFGLPGQAAFRSA